MYLVFTTNWGHKNKNYLQIRNNNNNSNNNNDNNNVYTIKICRLSLCFLHTLQSSKPL